MIKIHSKKSSSQEPDVLEMMDSVMTFHGFICAKDCRMLILGGVIVLGFSTSVW
jgi:hypothetical protein